MPSRVESFVIRFAIAAFAVGLLAVVSAPALAAGEMHLCTMAEIENGKVMRTVNVRHKSFEITHAERKNIPADTKFDRDVRIAKQTVLEASIEASASIEAEAGKFFAKASVAASVKVGGRYAHTSTTTVTEHFTIFRKPYPRRYVFYDGVDFFSFKAHKRQCGRDGQHDYRGKLSSFNPIDETGAVLCPHTRYKRGSINYQAALKGGC